MINPFNSKSYFYVTVSSRTTFYPKQVHLMETCTSCFLKILKFWLDNLSQIECKPIYRCQNGWDGISLLTICCALYHSLQLTREREIWPISGANGIVQPHVRHYIMIHKLLMDIMGEPMTTWMRIIFVNLIPFDLVICYIPWPVAINYISGIKSNICH